MFKNSPEYRYTGISTLKHVFMIFFLNFFSLFFFVFSLFFFVFSIFFFVFSLFFVIFSVFFSLFFFVFLYFFFVFLYFSFVFLYLLNFQIFISLNVFFLRRHIDDVGNVTSLILALSSRLAKLETNNNKVHT